MVLLTERTELRLEPFRALLEARGPWASVYIGLADRDPQGLPAERSARWHGLATALLDDGAAPDLVERLGAAVHAEPPGPAVLAAFAAGDGPVRLVRVPRLATPDVAFSGPLPRVLPLLGWLQDHPPYVLVVTDRTGADLETVAHGDPHRQTVVGPDDEIERNAPCGWAQGRYQHRAEDSWQHNAGQVAEAVGAAVRNSGARLVVVAGDVRAVQLLEEQAARWLRKETTWRHLSGGRSADGSQRARPERVEEVVQEWVDEEVVALVGRFAEERAPGGNGVEGVPETLDALARGQVAALLLRPDALAGRTAWFGPDPAHVLVEGEVPPPDWGPAVRAPLADVAVRAALGTRAQVWLVPEGVPGSPADGIGAVCRFR